MSFYSFVQKVKYRIIAKNRHGIHSPFVFNFVEKILNQKIEGVQMNRHCIAQVELLNKKQQLIVERLAKYYLVSALVFEDKIEALDLGDGKTKLYIFKEKITSFNFQENDIVLLLNIFKNKHAHNHWQNIVQHPNVALSVDIFEMGILMFREEFKVKQHFILRY